MEDINKKILISIIAVLILVIGVSLYFVFHEDNSLSKCGDKICDSKERLNPDLCPSDCKAYQSVCGDGVCQSKEKQKGICPEDCEQSQQCQKEGEFCGGVANAKCCKELSCKFATNTPEAQGRCVGEVEEKTCSGLGGKICERGETCSGSWLGASDSNYCCSGSCQTVQPIDYDNSPFGFHPGDSNNYVYIKDIGSVWSREGAYIIWEWGDINRNGNFKFKDATASRGQINYDQQWLDVPDNLNVVANVCPFKEGAELNSQSEYDMYSNFVYSAVERYDGDGDLGCSLESPDCYSEGDNEYPDSETVAKYERNPIKFWQVCNQLINVCSNDCKNTYSSKYALVQKYTYNEVKAADSSAYVLIGGDTGKELYPEVFSELNGNYIDIIDYHRFGKEEDYNPKEDLDYIKSSLQDSGFDLNNLKFWITETGTYSGDPIIPRMGEDLPYQSEKQHASGLFKSYISAISYGVEKVFWAWNIVEGFTKECSIFDYTGIVYDGCDCDAGGNYVCENNIGYDLGFGTKKLAYYTYKLMVEKLEGSDWDNIEVVRESNGIYVYKFNNQDKSIWVAWNDDSASQTISLSELGITGSAKITNAIPDADSGSEVSSYSTAFNTYTTSSDIVLGESPVFVEEN